MTEPVKRLPDDVQAALDDVLVALTPHLTPPVGATMNVLIETLEAWNRRATGQTEREATEPSEAMVGAAEAELRSLLDWCEAHKHKAWLLGYVTVAEHIHRALGNLRSALSTPRGDALAEPSVAMLDAMVEAWFDGRGEGERSDAQFRSRMLRAYRSLASTPPEKKP